MCVCCAGRKERVGKEMTVSITKRELEAIDALYDEVATNYEGASDENYIDVTGENLDHARKFIEKCREQYEVDFVIRRIYKRGGHVNKKWIIEQLKQQDETNN